MGGTRVRTYLYTAALATGGSFAILFTGETYDGADGGFGGLSVVAIIAGYKAFLPLFLASAVAVAVGSAGRYRFVLLFPAMAFYTVLAVYGLPPLFSLSEWRGVLFSVWEDALQRAGAPLTPAKTFT